MTEQEFEAEKTKMRQLRLAILRAYIKKLQTAMNKLKPGEASWSEVTGGLRMVLDQSRLEYRSLELADVDRGAAPADEPSNVGASAPHDATPEPDNPLAAIRLKLHHPAPEHQVA